MTETAEDHRDVVVDLLKQQAALLTELRWAYDQLERVQEVELAQLKDRVAELEQSGPRGGSVLSSSEGFSAQTRRRAEFALQHPDRAARAAGRRLAGPARRLARRAGIRR